MDAMKSHIRRTLKFVVAAVMALPSMADATVAGVVQFVSGDVQVIAAAGVGKPARKGTPLSVGDTVVSGRAATAQIKMGDGAIVVVQPESRVSVLEYRYEGREDGAERVRYRIEQGGMRAVTGAIGRSNKGNYLIETPVAHIGVRGTDHESYYFPSGATAGPDAAAPGAYNKVNTGLTYLRSEAGEVVVAPNQVGYVRAAQDTPSLLPGIPNFFNQGAGPRSAQVPGAPGADGRSAFPEARTEVVRDIRTAGGASLIRDPVGNGAANGATVGGIQGGVPGVTPGVTTGTVVGYVDQTGPGFGRSGVNLAIAPNGATTASAGGDPAWGVNWGSWLGGVATVGGAGTNGATHFMSSNQLTTAAQLASMPPTVVSATYSYIGGPAPTNHVGATGAITGLTVGANFSTQQITGYNLNATVGATTWTASGSGSFAQFSGASGISINGNCTGCAGGPSSPAAHGTAHGAFVGPAAERLMTSFGLKSAAQALSGAALLGR